jgi:hypothetical protein
MEEDFNFDLHIHCPLYRFEKLANLAIDKGLHAICITRREREKGNFDNFDLINQNRNRRGKILLNPKKWLIEQVSPVILKITNPKGSLYLIRGGELQVKQEDLLVFGIKNEEKIHKKDITEALNEVKKQGGIVIFPHLCSAGCGEKVYKYVSKNYPKYLTGLEINGQFPKRTRIKAFNTNEKVNQLAKQTNAPLFGFSDAHMHYFWQDGVVGEKYYSSVPAELINPKNIINSLKKIMLNHSKKIKIKGNPGTLARSAIWKFHSTLINPKKTFEDLKRVHKNN